MIFTRGNVMTENIERTPYYAERPLAVVIGCGDMGIGCARTLGARHALLVVDVDGERLDKAIATLRHEGFRATGYRCDISNADQVTGLAKVLADGPGVRVLAHVAALGTAPWRQVMKVNLIGVHLVTQAVGPHIVRGGVAIIVSSIGAYSARRDPRLDELLDNPFVPDFEAALVAAFGGEPTPLEAYCMAKRGINRLAETLADSWGPSEVRALSLSPGMIDSTMGRTSNTPARIVTADGEQRVGTRSEKARRDTPLERQGTLLEILSVVDFLASDAASFLNGIDIPVDGGYLARRRIRDGIER
jgi:NAD(P)-dependent dehydrogenase (short-subunit alcohol dehydrogenase family)